MVFRTPLGPTKRNPLQQWASAHRACGQTSAGRLLMLPQWYPSPASPLGCPSAPRAVTFTAARGDTATAEELLKLTRERVKELEGQVPRWIPVRRNATVGDVAWWYVLLTSDRAADSTGGVFTVDGGLDAQQIALRPWTWLTGFGVGLMRPRSGGRRPESRRRRSPPRCRLSG